MKTKKSERGFTLVEALIVTAILLLVTRFVLPIFYAKQMSDWGNRFEAMIGINPVFAKIIEGAVGILSIWELTRRSKGK